MQNLFRSATLVTTHLWFTVRTTTPLELDVYSGSALRGSFFDAIWQRFCTNKSVAICANCPLHDTCPVSAIVAPLREDNTLGQDIPRPYVMVPPLDGARYYQPGEHFSFGMTLIGNILQLLPYIILALPQLEQEGMGRRLPNNGGQRGRFTVERVEVYHPFTEQRQTLYETGKMHVNAPVISVHAEEYQPRAASLDPEQITLHFITPMRLVDRDHLVKNAYLRPLIQRLTERYQSLERHYGNPEFTIIKEEKMEVLQHAETIVCSRDQTQWQELKSYSNRQKRTTPIGGLIGQATFTGNLQPLLPLIMTGQLIHVGKNVVKGDGWYTIVTP